MLWAGCTGLQQDRVQRRQLLLSSEPPRSSGSSAYSNVMELADRLGAHEDEGENFAEPTACVIPCVSYLGTAAVCDKGLKTATEPVKHEGRAYQPTSSPLRGTRLILTLALLLGVSSSTAADVSGPYIIQRTGACSWPVATLSECEAAARALEVCEPTRSILLVLDLTRCMRAPAASRHASGRRRALPVGLLPEILLLR